MLLNQGKEHLICGTSEVTFVYAVRLWLRFWRQTNNACHEENISYMVLKVSVKKTFEEDSSYQ